MTTFLLTAALLSLALTLAAFWANPFRATNQAFSLLALVQTIWLACLYPIQLIVVSENSENALKLEWWLRANAAVVSLAPAALWLLKDAIVSRQDAPMLFLKSLPISALSLTSIFFCYTDSFVFCDPTGKVHRGLAYYIHSLVGLTIYAWCIVLVWRQMRSYTGIRRVELQFLVLNTGGAAFVIGILIAAGNFFYIREINRVSIVLAFATSALTAWALLFYRVFNAREMLLQMGRRLISASVLCAGIYGIWRATHSLVAEPFGLLIGVGLCGPIIIWLDRKSRD